MKSRDRERKPKWVRYSRVYILPTGFGIAFIAGAMTMILVGATYQNNLVNMLAFFMLSLIFIAMVQTHGNLKDIRLDQLLTDNGYAGGEFLTTTVLANPTRLMRFNLETRLREREPLSVYENFQPLPSKSSLKLRAAYGCGQRGVFRVSDVRVQTVFPLGLFRAWMWLEADSRYYVYPTPRGTRAFPIAVSGGQASGVSLARGGEDFHGHRRYELGDAQTHIDWKARARGRPLLIKEFNEGAPAPILLDWFALEGLETEERLSQLAAWVDQAVAKKLVFALRTPSASVPASGGPAHAQRCLEVLAAFDSETK